MAHNPRFDALLERMRGIHTSKNADYCGEGKDINPFQNFEDAAATAGCSVDTVFQVMIGTKLARLKVLLASGQPPKNESVQDSRSDLAMYAALWASYYEEAAMPLQPQEQTVSWTMPTDGDFSIVGFEAVNDSPAWNGQILKEVVVDFAPEFDPNI